MNDLDRQIDLMTRATADADVWHPEVLDAAADESWAVIERLLDAGLIHAVHDTLDHQLRDLMEKSVITEEDPEDAWLDEKALAFLPLEARRRWGIWVYYPWSQKLVHLLPKDAFLEVRFARNRNKITPESRRAWAPCASASPASRWARPPPTRSPPRASAGPSASRTSTASPSPTSTGCAAGSTTWR